MEVIHTMISLLLELALISGATMRVPLCFKHFRAPSFVGYRIQVMLLIVARRHILSNGQG